MSVIVESHSDVGLSGLCERYDDEGLVIVEWAVLLATSVEWGIQHRPILDDPDLVDEPGHFTIFRLGSGDAQTMPGSVKKKLRDAGNDRILQYPPELRT